MIYVVVAAEGQSFDFDKDNIYCGTDYEIAKQTAKDFKFHTKDNTHVYIEHWENGNQIKFDIARNYNKFLL